MPTELISPSFGFVEDHRVLLWIAARRELASLKPLTQRRLGNVVRAFEERIGAPDYAVLSLSSLGRRRTSDGGTEPNRPTSTDRLAYMRGPLLDVLSGRGVQILAVHQGSDGSKTGKYAPRFLDVAGPVETALPQLADSLGGSTFRIDIFLTAGSGGADHGAGGGVVGVPYVMPTKSSAAPRDPFHVDPDAVDRGLDGHNDTQTALKDFLADYGLGGRSPGTNEPQYDLAWEHDGITWVAEVKSTTTSNMERQLRLGLGQVLRYRALMAAAGRDVRAVLVAESAVEDPAWTLLCAEHGVVLVWPDVFEDRLRAAGAVD